MTRVTKTPSVTINAPLILKVQEILFLRAKHIMEPFSRDFFGVKKSRTPRKIPGNSPLYVLPQTKNNLQDFQNQRYISQFVSLETREFTVYERRGLINPRNILHKIQEYARLQFPETRPSLFARLSLKPFFGTLPRRRHHVFVSMTS
jgi:hypothetical protein